MRFKVKYILDENLDDDWIKNVKDALKLIMKYAPGLELEWETRDNNEASKIIMKYVPEIMLKLEMRGNKDYAINKVIWTTNNENKASTWENIFTNNACTISLWNTWIWHRQGTALHEILHSLGFDHEHCRKDRDHYVKLKDSEVNNYFINKFSQELTPYDPFSVMHYNESEKIERIDDKSIWKLK